MEAGADTRARNADGRTAAELAVQPAAARLLAREEAWLAAASAPRSCHVLFAGAPRGSARARAACEVCASGRAPPGAATLRRRRRGARERERLAPRRPDPLRCARAAGGGAGAWQGPTKCRFDAAAGAAVLAGAGGSPPPSPVKQSRLKRLLGHAKARAAPGEQAVALDGARLVELDARSLSIELPRAGRPGAAPAAVPCPTLTQQQECAESALRLLTRRSWHAWRVQRCAWCWRQARELWVYPGCCPPQGRPCLGARAARSACAGAQPASPNTITYQAKSAHAVPCTLR